MVKIYLPDAKIKGHQRWFLDLTVSSGKGSVPVMEVEPWTPTPDVQQVRCGALDPHT